MEKAKESIIHGKQATATPALIAEFLLLAATGAVGVALHAYLRLHLRLPGYHGLIYIPLLLAGKLISGKKYAGSISSIGAAAMLLLPVGFKAPVIPFIFLFPGFILDILSFSLPKQKNNFLLTAFFTGTAYSVIPLLKIIFFLFTPYHSNSFAAGFLYPVISHFAFGFAGGLLASGIFSFWKNIRKKKPLTKL